MEPTPEPQNKIEASSSRKQTSLDTDIVRDFLAIQKQEIGVRQNEVAIRGKEIDNQKEIAIKSIEAQGADLKDQRAHSRTASIITKLFVLLLILVTVALIIYLVEKGKDQMAIEIIKIVGIALISFGGGYFYGKSTAVNKPENTIDQTPDN